MGVIQEWSDGRIWKIWELAYDKNWVFNGFLDSWIWNNQKKI